MGKERSINIFIAVLAPFAIAATVWAVFGIPAEKIDAGVVTLTLLTIFCSCYLRIQLPRVNIHLTISDALVILALLLYGGEVAVILSIIEMGAASLNLYRKGVTIKVK